MLCCMVSALQDTPAGLHLESYGERETCVNWKFMGLDGIHPRILRELMEVHTLNQFPAALADWDLKIPADYKRANVMPV